MAPKVVEGAFRACLNFSHQAASGRFKQTTSHGFRFSSNGLSLLGAYWSQANALVNAKNECL